MSDRVKEDIRRKSMEQKGYRPLSPSPSKEKAKSWEKIKVTNVLIIINIINAIEI